MGTEAEKNEKSRFETGVLKKIVMAFLIGLVIGFLVHSAVSFKTGNQSKKETIVADATIADETSLLTISTVEEIVERAGDLVTTRYSYKDADSSENYKEIKGIKLPFTSNKVVFTYCGTVGLGMNLNDVEYTIDNEARSIEITLPEIGIVFNEIDYGSFEVPYESKPLFNRNDLKDYTEMIDTLQEKKAETVMNDEELITTATKNAQDTIKGFLLSADATKDYDVSFR